MTDEVGVIYDRRRDSNRLRHRRDWLGDGWPGHGGREALAWAAGLFDGEGYIGAIERKVPSSGRRIPSLLMSVNQHHDSEVIERFAEALGFGRVNSRVLKRTGNPTCWTWAVTGLEPVQAAVVMLWPWLSGPKRRQAVRALEAYHQRREVIGVRAWRRRGTEAGR